MANPTDQATTTLNDLATQTRNILGPATTQERALGYVRAGLEVAGLPEHDAPADQEITRWTREDCEAVIGFALDEYRQTD